MQVKDIGDAHTEKFVELRKDKKKKKKDNDDGIILVPLCGIHEVRTRPSHTNACTTYTCAHGTPLTRVGSYIVHFSVWHTACARRAHGVCTQPFRSYIVHFCVWYMP